MCFSTYTIYRRYEYVLDFYRSDSGKVKEAEKTKKKTSG